ncbi:MAG: hypothetical protein HZB79_09065 [Deltaproteobacteria bacterium]|nr:hypothetical protein [Deltaproteobacteria bacterium]
MTLCGAKDLISSPPLTHKDVENIITNGNGRTMPEHFDPKVLKAFIEAAPVFEEIFEAHTDLSANNKMEMAKNRL